ncbi:MAG: PAS domain-containing protein [Desulfurivibrionaceae bacterium]
MRDFLESLAGTSDFMPHGYCLVWDPELLWLHVGSDVLTGLAYYFIAAVLFYLVAKRRDLPFFWMFLLFGAFILACGTTHFMAAWIIYVPSYWLEGVIKTGTAAISVVTAFLLVPLLPKMLNLPNLSRALEDNRQLNQKLNLQVNSLMGEVQKRTRAEDQLKNNNALLVSLMDAIPDLIFYKDTNSTYLGCNKGFTLFLGHSKDEIIGQTDLDLFPKELAEFFREKDQQMLGGGVPRRNEEWVDYPDGRRVLLDTLKTPFFDADHNLLGLIGISRDITERKRSEEALHEANATLQAAMDQSPVGIAIADAPDGALRYMNKAGLLICGGDHQAIIHGAEINQYVANWHLFDFDGRPLSTEEVPLVRAILFGETCSREFIIRRTNGDDRIVLANAAPIRDVAGKIVAGIVVFIDNTESKGAEEEKDRLQAQLQQAQKMESVGRLAGGVAHDFNNMLGVIIGRAEMALEQEAPAQSVHADLTEILKAAKRSADITRQLLAFARKQTVMPKVLDLNEIVAGMLKMLQRLIGEDIHLTWQPKANLWPVMMDSSQVDQILANLCVNGRDAIADVGRITIETNNHVFDEEYSATHAGFLPGEYVQLVVSDDGCGMDRETQAHIFEPFFTTKGIGEGTGLGLATVYGIVKQNNGFINVYSEPGKGTMFTIYLPRYVGQIEQEQTERAAESAKRGCETILLVEDERAILEMTKKMLEKQGYTVLAASTSGEAMRLAREHASEINLLITDVVMPEINGLDLANNLLALSPHFKRLFMSGYTADVIGQHGLVAEGVAFIQKPFSRQDLAAKVREVLEGE